MFGRRKDELRSGLAEGGDVAMQLAHDRKFRRHAKRAAHHGAEAWRRLEQKRSHRTRNRLLVLGLVGIGGAFAFVPHLRSMLTSLPGRLGGGETEGATRSGTPRVIAQSIDVEVPVSTAYDQWTQFEEFPRFMEGVEEVRQLDDTLLHWVATVAGKRPEWDARILEQHRDRQVTWVSEDGKKTRGTVAFTPLGPGRTRIDLSMSYAAAGPRELVGSALGLDARRVRGDLERFKQFIEARGTETGAWRGNIERPQP